MADFANVFTRRLITEIPLSLKSLSDALLDCPVLEEVSFSDNAFGGRSAEPMVSLLSSHPTLSAVHLANNGLGVTGGTIIAKALFASAEHHAQKGRPSPLRVFVCGRNRLENGSAPFFGQAFSMHKNLEEVRLYQNGIRREGVRDIVRGLRACTGLKVLDLRDNVTTERKDGQGRRRTTGTRAIASGLARWPKLRELELTDCLLNIGNGGSLLAKSLAKGGNRELERLNLGGNEMTEEAVKELAIAIAEMPKLEVLDLNDNFGDEDDDAYTAVKAALAVTGREEALQSLEVRPSARPLSLSFRG